MTQNSFTTDVKLQEIIDEIQVIDAAICCIDRQRWSEDMDAAKKQLQVRYAYLFAMRDGIEDIRFKESANRGFAARW